METKYCLYLTANKYRDAVPVARTMDDDGCVHSSCQRAAGYLPAISRANGLYRGELSNWLRFIPRDEPDGRRKLAAIARAIRAEWRHRRPTEDEPFFPLFIVGAGVQVKPDWKYTIGGLTPVVDKSKGSLGSAPAEQLPPPVSPVCRWCGDCVSSSLSRCSCWED